jgi:hypothetical protein
MEKRRVLWKPSDKPLRKSERADWKNQFRNPNPPSESEAEENTRIAEQEEKEQPIREIYAGVQLHPGRRFPPPGAPPAYYLLSRDGHRIILTGMQTRFDFDDEQLQERWKNEDKVKLAFCKSSGCRNEIALIVKAWTDKETFKNMGSLIRCCSKCLAVTIGRPCEFRNGRLMA